MIHDFFGLHEQPFGVTPDPRYLYLADSHREALASLIYGVEMNRGFLALIARPGMGKTTLLFHLLEKFRHSARTALLFQTQCSSRELLRFLLSEFGVENKEDDLVRMHERFNQYLMEQSLAGQRVIVVIDEAQNLEPPVLETLRLLSNFETSRVKLLQIILAGQPELATKLSQPSLIQLRQRIVSFNGLDPLVPREVARFIDHRLNVARYQGPPLFTENAKEMVATLTGGIPREINNLCFAALSLACALGQKGVNTHVVREAYGDLNIQKLSPHPPHVLVPLNSDSWARKFVHDEIESSFQMSGAPVKAEPQPVLCDSSVTEQDRDIDSVPVNHDAGPSSRRSVQSSLLKALSLTLLSLALANSRPEPVHSGSAISALQKSVARIDCEQEKLFLLSGGNQASKVAYGPVMSEYAKRCD
jgi:type II secretory pathway predicted ATPase ExeA